MSPVSARLHVGLSPVVPLTTTPSWPCSTRWQAIAAVPSRSTAPSSVKAVAIAVSIRPKGAEDVMGVRLLGAGGWVADVAGRRPPAACWARGGPGTEAAADVGHDRHHPLLRRTLHAGSGL